ncbi:MULTISPECIES: hypothetical protein [unclassified Moorena]|uniref:NACHT domain-containing protein n=1 Tax=unclassified Moorena TaxID=2683338 RepID=UPI0013FFE72A|nr:MULTISPECIES: hypothetical protein [unclassified Moorena]NEO11233.1 hypothetical protein [Moorena sp. SIO3E8]NEP98855.1 hypothetical protein [Moorena sp. SIO3F7]
MSNQTYNWQRFWCSISDDFNLGYDGYLSDPDVTLVNGYNYNPNPKLVTFREISGIPCLILLGEPGIGKTQTMKEEEEKVTAELKNTDDEILSLDIGFFSKEDTLKKELFESPQFTKWQSGSHRLHIFLDSLDECLLRIQTLARILVYELKKYKEHVERLTLRIACRTAVLPSGLEPGLKELFGKDSLGIYQLVPLRRQDVVKAAKANEIDPDTFLEEVSKKNLVPLAIKPITLDFLLKIYCRGSGESLENKRIDQLYLDGCRCLCEEPNPNRRDSGAIGDLDPDQRLIIAARIAAVTIFANRFGVWTGLYRNYAPYPDQLILIKELCIGEEVANSKNLDITELAIKEVLDTGLFSSRGEKRIGCSDQTYGEKLIGWSHQTYAEFLAAWYLKEHNVSESFFQRHFYLCNHKDPEHKLIPQLHETAAWLATMISEIREVILSSDPDVLLLSDIRKHYSDDSDDSVREYDSVRERVVSNLLRQYEQGKINQKLINYRLYYEKLKHPNLAEQLRPYIVDATKQRDARHTAITMAQFCQLKELQNELVTLATDSTETIELRISAVQAIGEIGDQKSRLKLKPLALNPLPEDEQDRLKGCCLQAVFNKCNDLTYDEVFDILTPAKAINLISDSYRWFLNYTLVPMLKDKWLREPLKSDFIKEYGKSQKFVKALVNLGEINYDCRLDHFVLSLIEDIYLKPRLADHDQDWMEDPMLSSRLAILNKLFAQEIYDTFELNNTASIDGIIEDYYNWANQKWLSEQFSNYFIEGQQASKQALNDRHQQKLLDHRERIIRILDQLEDGNLSAWWWLNMEMTLKPDSRYYDNAFEPDLTKLPGWKEADELTCNRIIKGAEKYIKNQKDINTDWIGKKSLYIDLYIPKFAGYQAFLLLRNKAPEILETIPPETWRIWAPVIIAFPRGSEHSNSCLELVKRVYSNAPDQVIETLNILIDKENEQSDYIFVIRLVEKCWDKHLSDFILKKAQDKSLKPKCMGHLLEYILKHGSNEAKEKSIEYLQTFRSFPLPLNKDERDRVIIALTFLFYYPTTNSWSSIWSILEQEANLDLGRELIELVANPNKSFLGLLELKLNLNEKQLADLYIWMVRQYPYDEAPDHSNYFLGPREMVARLRDDILRQLKNIGTPDACEEVEGIIRECPQLPWLKKTLISAKDSMRRKTWKALQPKKVIDDILAHDSRSKTVQGNQGTSNNIVNLDNKGGIVNIGGKNTNTMAENINNNTNGGDVINNTGIVDNRKIGNNNNIIANGEGNNINVNDSKSNPNSGDIWNKILGIVTIVGVVAAVLGLFGNGIFNEPNKRFFRIDQQPSLSPTPTVPSPSSTPDSE